MTRHQYRGILVVALLAGGVGCAGKIPLPRTLVEEPLPELVERMVASQPTVRSFVGEARLTYLAEQGRFKATVTVAASRPGKLRYEVLGPHGAAIEAFATDGKVFQVAKLVESRFLYGPATKDNFDQILMFAPLHLDATGWVNLLFGEMPIGTNASLTYDAKSQRKIIQWTDANEQVVIVEVDPRTARALRMQVTRGKAVMTDVQIQSRDAQGMPSALRIEVPAQSIHLRIKLREMTYNPELDSDVFTIDPPKGAYKEYMPPMQSQPSPVTESTNER